MIVHFFDRQSGENPLNGSRSDSAEAVLRIVDAHHDRPAFFAELVGANGFNLLVGLGGPVGCAQYSPASGAPPYLVALNRAGAAERASEFLIGGTATPVPSRHCIPVAAVREVVRHFVENGGPSPHVDWEEI